jgi:hypothetical protein
MGEHSAAYAMGRRGGKLTAHFHQVLICLRSPIPLHSVVVNFKKGKLSLVYSVETCSGKQLSSVQPGGARGSVVVEAVWYKPEGCGFETRWGWMKFLNLPNPSGRTRPWGLLSL